MAKTRALLPLPEMLLSIIEKRDLGTQRELLAALRKAGHEVSQPTLSRHLKQLHIIKRRGRYTLEDESLFHPPPFTLRSSPPNLIVLKTLPARAQLLAALIDQAALVGIAGTTAGDDTVFVAVAGDYGFETVRAAIVEALQHHNSD